MYEYKISKIHNIYNGDTITVDIELGFGIVKKEKFRLALINTPELRGDDRENGLISRDWLRERLGSAEEIIIKTFKDRKGKYGRYIGELFIDDISVNKQMIAEGLAITY